MKVQAIVAAGGLGVRFRGKCPKTLIHLKGRPIFTYALERLGRCALIDNIILVVNREYLEKFRRAVKKYRLTKIKCVIPGGATRLESVRGGLAALDSDTDFVLIHDGARPFLSDKMIRASILAAEKFGAAITAIKMKPTIKRISQDGFVEATLDRSWLYEIQTPQVFKKEIILKAHAQAKTKESCDDAFLVEQIGEKVKVVEGSYKNIKITTPEDLKIAQALITVKEI